MSTSGEPLAIEKLRRSCDLDCFEFEDTSELEEMDGVIGQDRAVESVSFGIEMESEGYHVYALGPSGTGKEDMVRDFLDEEALDETVPDDWCYVNNFADPDRPKWLRLPAGRGTSFRDDMRGLVEQLENDVPRAFESEEYQRQQEQLQEEIQEQRQQLLQELEEEAQKENFTVLGTRQGLMLAPIVEGDVMTPDQFNELSEEQRERIEESREQLRDDLRETMRNLQELQQSFREKVRELDQRIIGYNVNSIIDPLKEKYNDLEGVVAHLEAVRENILDNVNAFKQLNMRRHQQQQMPFVPPGMHQQGEINFDKYGANLLVDNSETEGAPVVYESNPTYYNLVGRIEHKGEFGALTTDFTMIKDGSLHRANGGYLMLEVREVLTNPFAWDALKRALKNQEIKTESMGREFRAIQTQTLEPETIPLDVKVVLLGNPLLYYLLYNLDEDFQDLFKVKADFGVQTDWDNETVDLYAQFVGTVCEEEELSHFDPTGVGRLVEEGARRVSDQTKLDTRVRDLADLVRESAYWSRQNGNDLVKREDVNQAIEHQVYRSNRIEERIQEQIDDGTILIDTDETVQGQVNGLSVLQLGDYSFGKPSRITARTHLGSQGVVNIDREAELGGPIHNKGVMILSGYLGGLFAQDKPLALTARITFEQLYEGVEGDSASSTELYALLSSLSGYPIRQDIAVTGSINQRGQIQAIGGVNEKIEGFYKTCEIKGLTGEQGVMIPESNVQHLMLRDEVLQAVENDQFSIYAVSTVEEGIELLTGVEAGEPLEDGTYPEGTVKEAVRKQLAEYARLAKEFGREENGESPDG